MIQPEFDAHIIAGGESTRMRPIMDELGYPSDYPKHLLTTGNKGGETLVGRMITQAQTAPQIGRLTLHASQATEGYFTDHLEAVALRGVKIRTDTPKGNFGALVTSYLEGPNDIVAASGDSYVDTTWRELLDFHADHDLPVTYLVGRSLPVEQAAIFQAQGIKAVGWRREPGFSSPDDLINVGLYVFSQHPAVQKVLEAADSFEGAVITDALIDEGLLAVYAAKQTIYNVNNPSVYCELIAANISKAISSAEALEA